MSVCFYSSIFYLVIMKLSLYGPKSCVQVGLLLCGDALLLNEGIRFEFCFSEDLFGGFFSYF